MRWPVLRFERMFELHMARKGAGELKRERDMMIAALTGNSVFDETAEGVKVRNDRIERIQRDYKEGVEYLYSLLEGGEPTEQQPDPMESDPLFRPLRNRAVALGEQVSRPVVPEEGMGAPLLKAAG